MLTEREAVANYLRDVANKVETGFAGNFEFRWHAGQNALANLQVMPVTREQRFEYDERKFATIPHVAEILMAMDGLPAATPRGSSPEVIACLEQISAELRNSHSVSGVIE